MLQTIKRIVLWDFARASWQWDVLCILIMCFIFLTPKSWFENQGRNAQAKTLTISADQYSPDRETLRAKIGNLTGNFETEILDSRQRTDETGHTIYEIDIR
jgi:hypothetical protein